MIALNTRMAQEDVTVNTFMLILSLKAELLNKVLSNTKVLIHKPGRFILILF